MGVLGKGLSTTLSLWVNETLQCIFSLRFVPSWPELYKFKCTRVMLL